MGGYVTVPTKQRPDRPFPSNLIDGYQEGSETRGDALTGSDGECTRNLARTGCSVRQESGARHPEGWIEPRIHYDLCGGDDSGCDERHDRDRHNQREFITDANGVEDEPCRNDDRHNRDRSANT